MIRIKINALKETSGGDDISNFYQPPPLDLSQDSEVGEQLPQSHALHMPSGGPMSHSQTMNTIASPDTYPVLKETDVVELDEDLLYEKKDRCYRLAKQKYDVFPSAYASGFIVRCRKGKVGRKKKANETIELDEKKRKKWSIKYKRSINCDNPKGFSQKAHCQGRNKHEGVETPPQQGVSSGTAKKMKSDAEPETKYLTVDELVEEYPNIPYYKEVIQDYDNDDDSWEVFKKVKEYADYLSKHPETFEELPPIIFIDGEINDGAHRTSALWLLRKRLKPNNSFWKNAKLKVLFYKKEDVLEEGTFDKEKSQGLHGWFARKGGKGKSKGWVDCNTCRTNPTTGRKTCKTCGRQSGEQRSKYPACRPTPSACTRRGTSQKRGPMRVSWKKKKQEE